MFSPQRKKGKVAGCYTQIAFVSSCLPRKCGIATFSTHLSQALEKNLGHNAVSFVALKNNGGYDYPPQVIDEIEQDNLHDYYKSARTINASAVDMVSLQHEFGLFGGPDGIYMKEFLKNSEKPLVKSFHTVLQSPSSGQKKALKEVAAYSQALVVMNKLAISFITDIYNIPRSKICLIPHGVFETEYREPSYYKGQLKYQDRLLILTFGFLLSPNKGIETVLKALPALAKKAYALGRQKGWGNVSKQYLKIFADVMELADEEIPVVAGKNAHYH